MPSRRGPSKTNSCSRNPVRRAAAPAACLHRPAGLRGGRPRGGRGAGDALGRRAWRGLADVRGAQALAWFRACRLAEAAQRSPRPPIPARQAAASPAASLRSELPARFLAGAALEQRDLDTAGASHRACAVRSQNASGPSSRSSPCWTGPGSGLPADTPTRRWPRSTQRASSWPGTKSVLLARADGAGGTAALAASLSGARPPDWRARGSPAARRGLLLARVALAASDLHAAAVEGLDVPSLGNLTPRSRAGTPGSLGRRRDPAAVTPRRLASLAGVLQASTSRSRFLNTIVVTVPQVTRYLVDHVTFAMPDPFLERVIGAALEVCASAARTIRSHSHIAPLTDAELRVL